MPDVFISGRKLAQTGEAYSLITSPAVGGLGAYAGVSPYNTLRVSQEPGSLLNDVFDGTVIDASKWTTGGTNVPTQANGVVTLSLPATNSLTSTFVSKNTFPPMFGFLMGAFAATFDSAKITNPNCHRFAGFGIVTSYAASTPLTDGMGFEIDITGEFNCVVYIGGTRYVINSTNPALITAQGSLPAGASSSNYGQSITWPALSHRMIVLSRGDLIFFYIDSLDTPVGVASFLQPNVMTLPLRVASVTTPAVTTVIATTFNLISIGVGDTAASSEVLAPSGSLWSSPVNSSSVAYETSRIAKAVGGNLYGFSGYNSKATAQFIQLHDSATLPADAAVPVAIFSIPGLTNFSFDFGSYGKKFLNGITLCNSSTGPTKTIGSADCWFDVRYM